MPKFERDFEDEAGSVKALVAILQRLADEEEQTYLLLTEHDPKREYRFGHPVGLPVDQASVWEQHHAARRIVPGGGPTPTGDGPS